MYQIIYHKNCTDGLGAALAIHTWLKEKGLLSQATFQTAQYGDPAPEDVSGQDVLIVDFSYPREDLIRMHSRAKSLVVIDHHITAQQALHLISEICQELAQANPFAACYFDTNDGKRVFNLRSTEDGLDVSQIAKKYGGGGHPRAAGFSVERPEILPR